jgi:hypothetical protein
VPAPPRQLPPARVGSALPVRAPGGLRPGPAGRPPVERGSGQHHRLRRQYRGWSGGGSLRFCHAQTQCPQQRACLPLLCGAHTTDRVGDGADMFRGNPVYQALPVFGQHREPRPAIGGTRLPSHQSPRLEPIDQIGHAAARDQDVALELAEQHRALSAERLERTELSKCQVMPARMLGHPGLNQGMGPGQNLPELRGRVRTWGGSRTARPLSAIHLGDKILVTEIWSTARFWGTDLRVRSGSIPEPTTGATATKGQRVGAPVSGANTSSAVGAATAT